MPVAAEVAHGLRAPLDVVLVHKLGVPVQPSWRAELERRAERHRRARAMTPVAARTAVVVDNGIATGSSARAPCKVMRALGAPTGRAGGAGGGTVAVSALGEVAGLRAARAREPAASCR